MKTFIATAAAAIGCLAFSYSFTYASNDDSSDVREVAFTCANGETLSVHFLMAKGVAVLVRNGRTIELQQQPSGSGFIYSNGPNTIRGKGDDLIVEIGRMAPIQCKAKSVD